MQPSTSLTRMTSTYNVSYVFYGNDYVKSSFPLFWNRLCRGVIGGRWQLLFLAKVRANLNNDQTKLTS